MKPRLFNSSLKKHYSNTFHKSNLSPFAELTFHLRYKRKKEDYPRALEMLQGLQKKGIEPKNIKDFTTIIKLYSNTGFPDEAVRTYKEMISFGIKPDIFLCGMMVEVYWNSNQQEKARTFFKEMKQKIFLEPTDIRTYNIIIDIHSKFQNFKEAAFLFDQMKRQRIVPDHIIYNKMLQMYSTINQLKEATDLFQEMLDLKILPDTLTFNILFELFSRHSKLSEAILLWKELKWKLQDGVRPNTMTYNILIEMYFNHDKFDESFKLLKEMRAAKLRPNTFTYSIIIKIYANLNQPRKALDVFYEMKQYDIVPEANDYKILIELLQKHSLQDEVNYLMNDMRNKGMEEASVKLSDLILRNKTNE